MGDVTEQALSSNECLQVQAVTDPNYCQLWTVIHSCPHDPIPCNESARKIGARSTGTGTDMDFAAARDTMIESQVRTNDVSDLALQGAMRVVERETFVVAEKRAFAYAEVTSPTPSGRWLWKPRDFSKLAQAANALAGERVLVIAGAGGYSAAVFAALGCTVTVLDEVAVTIPGVTSIVGGLDTPPEGPFDIVFVDGGVETFPDSWTQVLAEQGRLCVVLLKGPMGTANIFTKSGGSVAGRVVFDATVPQLPGFRIAPAFAF